MDSFNLLMSGFATAATPMNLLYAFIGVLLGTAVGVLPGIGPAMAVALLLPVTYGMEPTSAFIMFAGIYYGGMYGGSTTSILLNTPGESSTVITAIEGHKMAKSGRAAQALATAAIGSFVAGTIGTALLVAFAPLVVKFAVSLGAPSYLAIMVLALLAVTAVLGSSKLRGFASLGLGLAIGLVGMDPVTGQQRLIFGLPLLVDGLDIVVVAVAIFAVGEALWIAAHLRRTAMHVIPVGRPWMGKQDWKRSWKPWLRGTAFGFPFGALPAGGAEIPTFLSYVTEKKLSKHPEEFGHGAIEGVAGPEAANNAAAAGTLTPMLALGLPTNATAAVMLAAFVQYGIQPGPLLFESEPQLVWALIASLFIGNTLLLLINLPLAPMWAKLLRLPRPYLYAGILFFATLGAYAVNLQAFDLMILLVLGLLGFAMRRFGYPILPLVIGLILGPRAEGQLRKSLQLSGGDISGLWNEPIAVVVYAIAAVILVWPLVLKLWHRSHPKPLLPVLSEDSTGSVAVGPRDPAGQSDESGAVATAPVSRGRRTARPFTDDERGEDKA
ncbi:tripartite tricarboxylate transporter permease [Arthrobacter sunyaminii]|uniref:Tripartite tricarboxylate transporter permease n=1 Tax=Arthrobacter sunyaminii TaxID=2816859 RepID=A0A975S6Y2_9MICC|nr:tripartite tricarboxylate transporter permease [Arthrobacter sunyaminii]MBO0907906.1 tripartite tricarboxylate transporter permease [Arthrobacter sunyaminii]QWQ36957.1 tripartite tricarboxylate transporter permease [Arthrobacter sunyaminii]